VVGEAANGVEAVKVAANMQPEVVLMDIRMPGMDGLEAARHIVDAEEPPAIIFCTAYEEHAVEAFNLQAVGYLLKPVRKDNLEDSLGKAQRVNKAQLAALAQDQPPRRTHISARTRKGIELIPVDDVRYFQADQKYVTVRHGEGEIIVDETLKELEEEFGERFIRVHRNALVAARFIVGLNRQSDGHYQIQLKDVEEAVDISRRHVAAVRKVVKSL
jgi:two-component system response regulator AlgR